MSFPPFARAAVAAALVLVAARAPAADLVVPFAVEGHGRLQLAVPEGWRVAARPADDLPAVNLRLEPVDGGGVVLLTAMAPPKAPTDALLREAAEGAARELSPTAAEEKLAVELRSGPSTRLALVSATDRRWANGEPPEGEWRHVTQGAAATGELLVSFTILTQRADGPVRARALELLLGARHLAAGTGPGQLRVAAAGKTLAAELPGLEVLRVDARPGGGGALVWGTLPGGWGATLTVEATPGLARAAEVRERRWTNGAARSPAEKTALRLSSRGDMELVSYVIPSHEGREIRQRHVHAYLLRGGVMGEVHLSKILYEPGDDAALERLLGSVRLE